MNQGINSVNLIFEDGENIFVEKNLFSNLYIANIDNEANEIPYEKLFNTSILYANFFILKISHLLNDMHNTNILKKTYDKKCLTEIELSINNKTVNFFLASDQDPFKKKSINNYDKSFFIENDLCLFICPYNIKYKNHLFS